ncbi:MAG: hypothetical protein ACK5P5_03130, partial [Pseudobdellovibrionaceae bacterium]
SKCFEQTGDQGIGIVSYDPETDFMFDHWGEMKIKLKLAGQVLNLKALMGVAQFDPKIYGFSNAEEFIQFIKGLTDKKEDELSLFVVEDFSLPSARLFSGVYTNHVGVEFISDEEFGKTLKSGRTPLILTTFDPMSFKVKVDFKYTKIQFTRSLENALRIAHPKSYERLVQESWKKQVQDYSEIYILGRSARDRSAIYLANLIRLGFKESKKVYLVHGGLYSVLTQKAEKPQMIDQFPVAKLDQLFQPNTAVVLFGGALPKNLLTFKEEIVFNHFVQADQLSLINAHSRKVTARQNRESIDLIDFKKMKDFANSKKMILIGHDDFDFRVALMGRAYAKENPNSKAVSYYPGGKMGLVNQIELGVIADAVIQESNSVPMDRYQFIERKDSTGKIIRAATMNLRAKVLDTNPFLKIKKEPKTLKLRKNK